MPDVRMIERGRSFCFLNKAPHSVLIGGDIRRQNLQCDFAIKFRILCEMNFAPPAPSCERIS
jgi:hypothetical protein